MLETTQRKQEVIIVTGAASGMGRAVAQCMAARRDGRAILLCDLQEKELEQTRMRIGADCHCEILAADLSAPEFGERLQAFIGDRSVGALIHCAGLSSSMADAERIFAVNLVGTLILVDTVRSRMARDGAAVLFASLAGHLLGTALDEKIMAATTPAAIANLLPLAGSSREAAYSISKRAVQLLARREARAFGERGARINSLSPGVIDTPMGRAEMVRHPVMQDMIKRMPLKRAAQPEEVAEVAAFLCSAASSFITGTDILVDGGSLAEPAAG